jgi:hypothetical protein
MHVQEIIDRVGAKVLGVGKAILQADPASEAAEEIEHLRGEQARQDDRLATLRGQVAVVMQRLAENESAAARLHDEVASSVSRNKPAQAMRQALELDGLRREIDSDRGALKRLEHAVWCLEFRLRQLVRRMERMREDPSERT